MISSPDLSTLIRHVDLAVLAAAGVLAASFIFSLFRLCESFVRRKP